MKRIYGSALPLLAIICTSCGGQSKPGPVAENIRPAAEHKATFQGSDVRYHSRYEYTNATGKRLTILNSLPKGEPYKAPDGREYFRLIFWTMLVNETDHPLQLKIGFPVKYEVADLPGIYYKVTVAPDTMTIDKEPLHDYGMKAPKPFLDQNIFKPSSLTRTVESQTPNGFYTIVLFDKGISGPFRAGLSIKGQDLIYKISQYAAKAQPPLIKDIEINCGKTSVNDLTLQTSLVQ